MKPSFTSSQEMYNYAANQLINQNLSPETVKNNLMERGVTDADAETCVQNMLVVIEKNRGVRQAQRKFLPETMNKKCPLPGTKTTMAHFMTCRQCTIMQPIS